MPVDIQSMMKNEGMTWGEVARALADRHGINYDKAKGDSLSDKEIAEDLATYDAPLSFRQPPEKPVPKWGQRNPNLYGAFGAGKALYDKVGKPMIEAGGMIGGGMAGAPTGHMGAVAGAGLGHGIAKQATNAIEAKMGALEGARPRAPGSLGQRLMGAGQDVAQGMTDEMLGQAAPRMLQQAVAPYGDAVTQSAKQTRDLYRKHGLEPSPTDMMQTKSLGLAESMLEKTGAGPFGLLGIPQAADVAGAWRLKKQLEPLMKRRKELLADGGELVDIEELGGRIQSEVTNYLRTGEKLKGAKLEKMRGRILGEWGSDLPLETLGLKGKSLLAAKFSAFQKRAKDLYTKVGEDLPPGSTFNAPTLSKVANKHLKKSGKLPSQKADFVERLNWAAKGEPQSWETLQDFRQQLNSAIQHGDTPGLRVSGTPEEAVYTQLIKALDKDLPNIAKSYGGKAWDRLETANAFYSKHKPIFKNEMVKRVSKVSPEKVMDAVFVPNGITEVKMLKNAVGPEGFKSFRDGFTKKLVGAGQVDAFNPKALKTMMNRYGDSFMHEVYGKATTDRLKAIARDGLDLTKRKADTKFLGHIADMESGRVAIVDNLIGSPWRQLESKTMAANMDVLRKATSKETYDAVGRQVLEKMLALNQYGKLSPKQFAGAVEKYGDRVLKRFYPKEKVAKLKDLAYIGRSLESAERIAGNPSGTAQTIISWDTAKMWMYNPVLGATYSITPGIMAKLFYSKTGIKYLTDGFKMRANTKRGAELATKLMAIMSQQEEQ